jgi:hypothetical protein
MKPLSAFAAPHSFHDANKSVRQGERLISNAVADDILVEGLSNSGESAKSAVIGLNLFWTGTIVAYPESGEAFGDSVETKCRQLVYSLDTGSFRGRDGIALAFDDYQVKEKGSTMIFLPRGITIITDFPQIDGWYGVDGKHCVPVIDGSKKRFLWRSRKARLGPAVRGYGNNGWARKDVFLHHRLSDPFSIILETASERRDLSNVLQFPARTNEK